MIVRDAEPSEIQRLAQLWFDAWRDAHAALVPAELLALRTLPGFTERLRRMLPELRVTGPAGEPCGFSHVRHDELDQLFVAAAARGTGAAAALLHDAEARLAASGVEVAWLSCAIGNVRAARFYEKWGWHRIGTMIDRLETSAGPFALEVWRYEKQLAPTEPA
jgi:GNAT superfamily N-acetyltransferase